MRRWRGCLVGLLAVVVLLVGGAAGAWWWLRSAPAWYAPPDRNDPAVREFAQTVETRVVEELQRIRPVGNDEGVEETWTLRFRDGQLNAWLATRLSEWLEREASVAWPEALGAPQAHFSPAGIDIGVQVHSGPLAERVLVARVEPQLTDEGLVVRLVSLGLGRASLARAPLERLTEILAAMAPPEARDAILTEDITRILDGQTVLEPIVPLADGREVHVVGFRLHDGAIDVTSRTR